MNSRQVPARIAIGDRIRALMHAHPHATAIVVVGGDDNERSFTWAELEAMTNSAAHLLQTDGVSEDSVVVVALPTDIRHVVMSIAAWKLGCLVVPIDPDLVGIDRREVIAALGRVVVVDETWGSRLDPETLLRVGDVPVVQSRGVPRSASATGGSTAKARIVIRNRDWMYGPDELPSENDRIGGLRLGQTSLVALPFYHAGFVALHHCLALDHTVVLLEKFQPRLFLDLMERYRVNCLRTAPTVMRSLLDVPGIEKRDLSSVEAFHHGAAHCPEAVKRRWLQLLPPRVVYEDYGSVERLGSLTIRGDEWLKHPGSVGRPQNCEVRIVDDGGEEAPVGQIGEIFMRSTISRQPHYVGSGPLLRRHGEFLSVGDMGYLDADGYLYIADRRSDIIVVGGTNVYPKEVANVIASFTGVRDVFVTRRPHEYLGDAVHAIIVAEQTVELSQLDRYCRANLAASKVPLSYSVVDRIPRNDAGKIPRGSIDALTRVTPPTSH